MIGVNQERILRLMADGVPRTTAQIDEALRTVPTATLYQSIHSLARRGMVASGSTVPGGRGRPSVVWEITDLGRGAL